MTTTSPTRAPLLTAEQVAEDLQVPETWVYRAARSGDLPSIQCGRYRRFHAGDLEDWIDNQRGRPEGAA